MGAQDLLLDRGPCVATQRRAIAVIRAYWAGVAAEAAVERTYLARGAQLLQRRWRGKAGEIDLI